MYIFRIKQILIIALTGLSSSCYMHFSQIYSNRSKPESYKPVKRIHVDFVRIPEKWYIDKNLRNFNPKEINDTFHSLPNFIVDKKADLKIEYSSESRKLRGNSISGFLFVWTLGGIPFKSNSESNITFRVSEKRTSRELGVYEYRVNQATWFGWLSVPMSLVVVPFLDTVKEITTDEGLAFHKRIIGRFSRDFLTDMKNGIYSRQTTARVKKPKSVFIVIEGNDTEKKYKEQSKILNNLIEVALVNGSYKIADRKNTGNVLEEQAFSKSGLTKENTSLIGNLSGARKIVVSNILDYSRSNTGYETTYIINITDIKSGEVEWKNLYTIKGRNIDEMFKKGSALLMKDLDFAGYR